ncbi:MAG: hypothetical protein LBS11_09430 [Oscillospiraceae bacterium]|nr:hypothetical protein [Oscillospiraceae bacterium]
MPDWHKLESIITPDQCDETGITRPDAWFQLFQWIAAEHSRAMRCDHDGDLPPSVLWIMLGAHTQWHSPARAGDTLLIRTAPAAHSHGMYQRRINITDVNGKPIADNVGFWTLMDRDTRRITRNGLIQRRHTDIETGDGVRPAPFVPLEDARAAQWSYTPGAVDIDNNGHVNNARYIAWMDAALRGLSGGPVSPRTLDVWYAAEVMPGEPLAGKTALADDGRFTFEVFRQGAGDEKARFTASGFMLR